MVFLGITALLLTLSQSLTRGPAVPANPEIPGRFDIAGVKIGMSTPQVQSILGGKGFVVKGKLEKYSFSQRLWVEMERNRGRQPNIYYDGVRQLSVGWVRYEKNTESVIVHYAEGASGLYVIRVFYKDGSSNFDPMSVARLLTEKWGKPTVGSGRPDLIGSAWCDAQRNGNRGCSTKAGEILAYDDNSAVGKHVILEAQIEFAERGEKEFKAAVAKDYALTHQTSL